MFHSETTEGRPMSMMSVSQIAALSRKLKKLLYRFRECFARPAGRTLLLAYVQGLMSVVQRKNVEAMALDQNIAPRTLQRLLDSIAWDHDQVRDLCQQIVANEHAHPEAIGCIDETGTVKSGPHTAGVKRQYNGSRGKIENCVNTVALSYSAPGFSVLLDTRLYLPDEWANDAERRKKVTSPTTSNSVRSHKSRSLRSIARLPTASALWDGRPMNSMGRTPSSSMHSTIVTRRLRLRSPATFVCGRGSQKYGKTMVKTSSGDQKNLSD